MSDRHRPIAAIAITVLVAACGSLLPAPLASASPAIDDTLHVDNGTTLAITIVVNGGVVGIAAAKGGRAIPVDALPPLPWSVEARSASGRVVLTLAVAAGSVTDVRNPDGTGSHSAPGARADLSCGRLDIYPGNTPMLGPAPGPGVPGDCVP